MAGFSGLVAGVFVALDLLFVAWDPPSERGTNIEVVERDPARRKLFNGKKSQQQGGETNLSFSIRASSSRRVFSWVSYPRDVSRRDPEAESS